MLFYPQYDTLEVTMKAIRGRDPSEAEHLLDAMRSKTTKQLTDKIPQLPNEEMIDRWEEWERDVLDPYVQARVRAKAH